MTVNIHGKEYKTVAERVNEFRNEHKGKPIETECLEFGDIVRFKAIIRAEGGKILATGYAEEKRGSTNINKTSAVENCETSALGRALANFGYAGTEYASAEEVSQAIIAQEISEAKKAAKEYYANHNKMMLANLESLNAVRSGITEGNLEFAAEAWFELSEDQQQVLFLAPSAGGFFTTKEREVIKSSEFRKAHFGE